MKNQPQKPSRRKTPKAKPLRPARGYIAKGSHLGELLLFESFIEQHIKEIRVRLEYLERLFPDWSKINAIPC